MEFIAHRINCIKDLENLPKTIGIELDLREFNGKLVLQHDPFTNGQIFEELLIKYNHGTMILNIKSERIEFKVLELIKKYNIEKYFFLDSTFPMVNHLIQNGENNIALRFSEYEGIDTIINSDKILFLEAGSVVEYDDTQTLLADPTSYFAQFVDVEFATQCKTQHNMNLTDQDEDFIESSI